MEINFRELTEEVRKLEKVLYPVFRISDCISLISEHFLNGYHLLYEEEKSYIVNREELDSVISGLTKLFLSTDDVKIDISMTDRVASKKVYKIVRIFIVNPENKFVQFYILK